MSQKEVFNTSFIDYLFQQNFQRPSTIHPLLGGCGAGVESYIVYKTNFRSLAFNWEEGGQWDRLGKDCSVNTGCSQCDGLKWGAKLVLAWVRVARKATELTQAKRVTIGIIHRTCISPKVGTYYLRTILPREASSKGLIVQMTHHTRDT
jgi:hypothetical protein